MKIAVPVYEKKLCSHFGHCEEFAVIDITKECKINEVKYLTPPPHEPGVLPKWLADLGVDVIIAGGMGMKAQQIFLANNVDVVIGAKGEKPEEIAENYIKGALETGQNLCSH